MSPAETFLACISGQKLTLAPPEAGGDVERMLGEAMGKRFILPDSKINVLTLHRSKLLYLAKRLLDAPTYRIKANENITKLQVEQYDLINCSVIIFKVIDEEVMMHGIKDGEAPMNGNTVDWEKIRERIMGGI